MAGGIRGPQDPRIAAGQTESAEAVESQQGAAAAEVQQATPQTKGAKQTQRPRSGAIVDAEIRRRLEGMARFDEAQAAGMGKAAARKAAGPLSKEEASLAKMIGEATYNRGIQTYDLDEWLEKEFLGDRASLHPDAAVAAADILREYAPTLREIVYGEGGPYVDSLIEQLEGLYKGSAQGGGDI